MQEPYSISAGLDYPGIGPLISQIAVQERAEVLSINDDEALRAAFELTRLEGIIPALESSHRLGSPASYEAPARGHRRADCERTW